MLIVGITVLIGIGLVAVSAASVARVWIETSAQTRQQAQRQQSAFGWLGEIRDAIVGVAEVGSDED